MEKNVSSVAEQDKTAEVKKNPKLIERFLRATHKGWRDAKANPKASIDAMVEIARDCDGRPDRHAGMTQALRALYLERARAHGCPLDDAGVEKVLGMDIELNAQGLATWLDRDQRGASGSP